MESPASGWKTLWRLLRLQNADRSVSIRILLLLALSVGLGLARPWPLAVIADHLLNQKKSTAGTGGFSLGNWILLGLLIHLAHALIQGLTHGSVIRAGLEAHAGLRQRVFDQIGRLSMRCLQRFRSGDLIQRVAWDTASAHTALQQIVYQAVQSGLTLVVMAVILFQLHPLLTGVAFLVVPFLMVVVRLLGRSMSERGNTAQASESRTISRIHETLNAIPVLKVENRIPLESRLFAESAREAAQLRWIQHRTEVTYTVGIVITLAIGISLVTWRGAEAVRSGELTMGGLLIFLAYLGQFYEPVQQISYTGATVADVLSRSRRVFELLDLPPEETGITGSLAADKACTPLPPPAPVLEISQVRFSYKPGVPVLRGVNLKVESCETVALVGPSGAGKSTLLQLLARLEDPDEGKILWNDLDLKTLDRGSLRRSIGVVFQEPVILSGTVAENIALSVPGASREEIELAARLAHADRFIRNLPDGFETRLGEGQSRLSVGEKQRIHLARVFLKKPALLLLDEPTSALDEENERLVVDALEGFLPGRTAILVTHRPKPLRLATRTIVMESGTLV